MVSVPNTYPFLDGFLQSSLFLGSNTLAYLGFGSRRALVFPLASGNARAFQGLEPLRHIDKARARREASKKKKRLKISLHTNNSGAFVLYDRPHVALAI